MKTSKAEMDTELKEEIKLVKDYLSQCPTVSKTSAAIRITMSALDQELKRIERDEKLRRKFNQHQVSTGSELSLSDDEDLVRVEAPSSDRPVSSVPSPDSISGAATTSLKDWQEIEQDPDAKMSSSQDCGDGSEKKGSTEDIAMDTRNTSSEEQSGDMSSSSLLGASLAQAAISEMSNAQTTVSTPTASLALAIHAGLRSKVLEFKCTGVPDCDPCFQGDSEHDSAHGVKSGSGPTKSKGFAPPVRELPRGVFVPSQWDRHASAAINTTTTTNTSKGSLTRMFANTKPGECDTLSHCVVLRYSKIGMPTTILRVRILQKDEIECIDDNNQIDDVSKKTDVSSSYSTMMIKVSFGPEGGEPVNMTFPIDQHINMEGFRLALSSGNTNGVRPALYYKRLPDLFEKFCQENDLGAVKEGLASCAAECIAEKYNSYSNLNVRITDSTTRSSLGKVRIAQPDSLPTAPNLPSRRDGSGLLIPGQSSQPGRIPRGDFPDDLLPSGVPLPGFAQPYLGGPGGMSGNLMGPNHPAFHGHPPDDGYVDDGSDFTTPGGLRMQPRYDPYYPPGVGGFPGRGRGRGRFDPGRGRGRFGSGDPNPDHLKPPNNLNGRDMFM